MSWLGSLQPATVRGRADEEFSGISSEATTVKFGGAGEGEVEEMGSSSRRVKEDLSEFTKTLSNKFWGVASFLAPPPSSQTPSSPSSPRICFSDESSPSLHRKQQDPTISGNSELVVSCESPRISGFRSDFAEIGGTFRTGISRISNNVAISEISKIASTFLTLRKPEEEEEEEDGYEDEHISDVIGITDEVLAFAMNIACHPETWLDFPLLSEDGDFDDFDMSVAQQDHAFVIQNLAPRLAALRIELCPSHMRIGCFWKIYFVLLHPRLNKHDAELLSTPQIVEARAMLHGLQNHARQELEAFRGGGLSFKEADAALSSPERFSTPRIPVSPAKPCSHEVTLALATIGNVETEEHSILSSEVEFVDKFVINEGLALQVKENIDDEDDDDWPEDEIEDVSGAEVATIHLSNEEDISFSDLEDDDFPTFAKRSKSATHGKGSI